MRYGVELLNPYSLTETLVRLRQTLVETNRASALELLEKAISKSQVDDNYARLTEETLLNGSTVELRQWLSEFGDYWAGPRAEFPFYPHTDAVNGIDSAMHEIKFAAGVYRS